MRYDIQKKSGTPAYLQLYRLVRKDITDGLYAYGDRLPSKRTLAEDAGVSLITVEHTYELLIDEGYAESRERSGYYVIYREGALLPVADENASPVPVSDQAKPAISNHNYQVPADTFPFSVLARTMRAVLTKYGEDILVKSPAFGIPELRQAIAGYLGRSRGIRIRPEQVIIGSGAEYMYSMIVQMLGRDKIYALEDPSYEQIRKVYTANGVTCQMLKMGEDGILTRELMYCQADVLHVTPYHSYPCGITASASKRRAYIEWATRHHAFIIEDDVDSEFTMSSKPEDTVFSLEPEHTVLYLNTLSRTIAPSIRIAYMVLPSALSADLQAKIDFYACSVPVYDQYVLAELIANGDFERHINRIRRKRRKT